MLGIAQRLFTEKYAKNPWKIDLPKNPPFPLLEQLLASHHLGFVDLALAQKILRSISSGDEACAAFLCHLSMASRQGHLCVTIDDDQIVPPPEEIWSPLDGTSPNEEITHSLMFELKSLIISGVRSIDPRLIWFAQKDSPPPLIPVCKNGNNYYLQRQWILETNFINHLDALLKNRASISLDLAKMQRFVDALADTQKLLPDQAKAVIQGLEKALTVITGGPGTGKTYTAGILLRTFWEGMTNEQRQICKFALAAPTGKAAAQLETSIQRALHGVDGFPALKAQTLHALLGVGRNGQRKSSNVIQADLLLVDESSMIDARMMGHLMGALKPGTRLIMLGDKHQLPPIEAGSFFGDLVFHLQSHPERQANVTALTTCLRAELQGILELANQINAGDVLGVNALLQAVPFIEGIQFVNVPDDSTSKELQHRLLRYASNHFPFCESIPSNPLDLLKQFSRFRLLTPMRQGPLGVEMLNAIFYQSMAARRKNAACFVVPIMIAANDTRLSLFNGELGLLVRHHDDKQKDFAIFPSKDNGIDVRKIAAVLLPTYEYAYCVSVHKSQGSEFDHVVLVLPEGSERFGREALYTGVTRARSRLELWSAQTTLNAMLKRQFHRHSGLVERL